MGACKINEEFPQFNLKYFMCLCYCQDYLINLLKDENSYFGGSNHMKLDPVLQVMKLELLSQKHVLQRHTPTLQHPNWQLSNSLLLHQNFCTNPLFFQSINQFLILSWSLPHFLKRLLVTICLMSIWKIIIFYPAKKIIISLFLT